MAQLCILFLFSFCGLFVVLFPGVMALPATIVALVLIAPVWHLARKMAFFRFQPPTPSLEAGTWGSGRQD